MGWAQPAASGTAVWCVCVAVWGEGGCAAIGYWGGSCWRWGLSGTHTHTVSHTRTRARTPSYGDGPHCRRASFTRVVMAQTEYTVAWRDQRQLRGSAPSLPNQ